MKALYIERHNAAGRRIAQEFCNGAHGNRVMHWRLEMWAMLESVKGLEFHGTRIPDWLLSDQDCDTSDSNISMMRPDLMVINTTNQTAATLDACKKRGQHGRRRGILSTGHPEHPVKVMIVEVGYTSENRYAEKLQEKMTQHGKLQRALSRAGFQVNILQMILGTTGGVFNSNLDNFRATGIPNKRALHLFNKNPNML